MKITWQQPTKKIKPPNTKKLPEKPKKEKIFQTSTDIFSDILSEKGENNSFIVQSVYSFEDKKVLVTKEGEVVLEEKWAELKIESGDCFSVYKCPCCLTNTTNDIYLNPIKNNSTNFTTSDKNIILVINDDSNVILILNDNLMNVTLISESFDCINKPFFRSKVLQFSLEPLDKFIIIGRIIHSLIEKYYKSNFNEGNLFKKVIDLLKEVIKENDLLIKKSVYFLKNNSLEMNQLVMNDCLPHLKYLINFFEKVNGLPEVFFTSVKYGLKGRVDLLGECVYEFKSTNLNFKHQIQSVLYLLLTDKPVILVSTKNGNNLSFDLERKTENKSMTDLERKTESKLNTDCSKSISENKSMTDCSKSMTENKFNLINHQLIRDILILRNKALINIKRFNYEECNKCLECILYSKLNKCYSLLFNILKEEEENKKIKVFYKRQDLTQEKSISGSTVLRRVFFCHSDLLEKSFYKVYFNNTFITKCKVINNYLLTYDLIDFSNFIYFYLEEDCDIFFYVYRYSLLYTNEVFKMFDEERIYERFMKNKLISKDNGLISKDDRLLSKDGLISKDNGLMTDDCKSMTGDCKLMTDDKIINSSYFGVSNLPISLQIPSYFTKEFLQFNAYQRKIILYSLNLPSKFYLIHGLPGTGKSKCIRFIVKLLTNYSKKVLVMTYTNRSLDLLKGIDNAVYINCFNYTELTEYKFDYLIVDEATQMHFPFCLVGLDMCDKIVLFGDDKQLAPICKDRRLGISIFELVKKYLILNQNQSKKEDSKKIKVKEECEKIENFEKISFDSFSDFDLSDENISNNNTPLLLTDYLKITYRMSIKITALANILFYNNKLISHSKHIGEINYFDTTDLSKLLLLKSELVVLCFYNDTVSYVKSLYNLSDKQVSTIDRYQGSECENVILFVDRMSELCKSRERVNVAVTRSKKLFYLVGDRKMISECEVLSELVEVIERIKDD